ncbi:MAG: helix-turn-helix transcriptional regulator [Planctomycetes bacterium]|nr:helix-turn-helix transcriptional regulator [Planctomycetota bacterium]
MKCRTICFAMKKVSGILFTMPVIYEAIRKAISDSEKTRYQLWQETGISQAQLCEFLHGRRGMSMDNLETLAKALGLEILTRPVKKRKRH